MGEGVSFLRLAVIACLILGACSSKDDEIRTVPEGVKPEDATFIWRQRKGSGGDRTLLTIRMSTVSFCDAKSVPNQQGFVEINVVVPLGSEVPAATYGAGSDGESEIILLKTSSPECNGNSGQGVATGSVTIQEVAPTQVRGSFRGTNDGGKLDLQGTFIAKSCPNDLAACR